MTEIIDGEKVLQITKEKYLAFCSQFYPYTYPFSKALEKMELPYMLLMVFYRGLNFDGIEPLSKLVKKGTLDYIHGKKSVTIEALTMRYKKEQPLRAEFWVGWNSKDMLNLQEKIGKFF